MSNNNSMQFFKKYELGKVLGTGAFSEVKIAINRQTKEKFAVKIIDKSKCKGKENMIDTEISILSKVHHENIVRLYDLYQIDNKIYLVMELVTGGELFDDIVRRGKYTESDAAKIVQKILLAIDYLHGMGIAHRDLKPENLLLSDKSKNGKVMISDFGLSKIFNDEEVMKTACGTPGYVAPEVLKRQGYGKEVDLWSIGVITYILLCGYPPFYDQNNVELYKQILACRYEFEKPWWDNISEDAKGFIRKLLVLDPAKRYTAKQAVNHPFIVNNCGPPPAPVEHIPKEIPPVSYPKREGSSDNGKEKPQEYYKGNNQAQKDSSAYNNSNNLAPGVTKKLQQVLSTKNIKIGHQIVNNLYEITNPSNIYNNNKNNHIINLPYNNINKEAFVDTNPIYYNGNVKHERRYTDEPVQHYMTKNQMKNLKNDHHIKHNTINTMNYRNENNNNINNNQPLYYFNNGESDIHQEMHKKDHNRYSQSESEQTASNKSKHKFKIFSKISKKSNKVNNIENNIINNSNYNRNHNNYDEHIVNIDDREINELSNKNASPKLGHNPNMNYYPQNQPTIYEIDDSSTDDITNYYNNMNLKDKDNYYIEKKMNYGDPNMKLNDYNKNKDIYNYYNNNNTNMMFDYPNNYMNNVNHVSNNYHDKNNNYYMNTRKGIQMNNYMNVNETNRAKYSGNYNNYANFNGNRNGRNPMENNNFNNPNINNINKNYHNPNYTPNNYGGGDMYTQNNMTFMNAKNNSNNVNYQRYPVESEDITSYRKFMNNNPVPTSMIEEKALYYNIPNNMSENDYEMDYNRKRHEKCIIS
ncbi:Pkinase-domain-containing protein [Neocallimastix californiae]|uniref:Pkinase-domain-containing protein n=1 Tax=Neocallimastix californiae TaxID=1754190 RepID=A0A1Y2CHY5_9FUNG|nr:Pkinase-domain-containing protein [Neocallimastix californiae]|eukprot:ORY46658.1 Pkinase-domain-containing protein [Neocallimastix californiae]